MRELIDRLALASACREICEEVAAEGKTMTAKEVRELMLRFEEIIRTAPVADTTWNGFKNCKYYPKNGQGNGCSLLTERLCAVKGRCGFFDPAGDEPPPAGLPENLRAARLARGMSTEQLGRAIGTSRQRINKWELGDGRPSPENLEKLAAFFGMSIEELTS